MKPIRPEEIAAAKIEAVPEIVFAVFNDLIIHAFDGHGAAVSQETAISELRLRDPDLTREQIFGRHMLDVEDAYRVSGWDVVYDSPGYNEVYSPTYHFTRR